MSWIPKVEEKRHFCHKCKNELVFEVKLQRADTCPHCGVDMHCCKNCEYWDISAHNQCKEHIAEYIPDREKALAENPGSREASRGLGLDVDLGPAVLVVVAARAGAHRV